MYSRPGYGHMQNRACVEIEKENKCGGDPKQENGACLWSSNRLVTNKMKAASFLKREGRLSAYL